MPPRRTTPQGYENARLLRKEPTTAERKLWAYLRGNKINNVNFRRQHAIGYFVPDFCAIKEKLVIELDGLPSVAASRTRRIRRRKNSIFGITGL